MSETVDIGALFGETNRPNQELPKVLAHNFQLVSRGDGPFREKYRPQRINEIVPTCSIELLRNQIDNPNASKIYLFEGESGTGKTTCARILAKANICLAINSREKPCLKCDTCKSFETSFDKTELNAANQNRIEDIRSLIEDMRYAPSIYKRKIYILDEVQRLTPAAQQVLLTELEEPHPYLLVFLCTTDIKEINKALADRACRITFGKLTPEQARSVIDQVFKHEHLKASEEIIESFYLQSRGSVRALLNCIQSYSQNGYDPKVWPEDETTAEVNELYKYIVAGDWPNLSKALTKPNIRKEPESLRMGLENYFRAVILRTSNLSEAVKLGSAMIRISGSMILLPTFSQYNEFVLKCLRACSVFK